MRSNVEHWQEIQKDGYFETHPCYNGLKEFGPDEAVYAIEQFRPLATDAKLAVIGCGYGRESLGLARKAGHVWGIDVSPLILGKAHTFLSERGVTNFTGVLAESYADEIPDGLDLVFSLVVMQHLTRDLVRDYFLRLGGKLKSGGCFVVQFIESIGDKSTDVDLSVKHEPSVSWTVNDLHGLSQHAGVTFREVRTILATPDCFWHWAYFTKEA